MLYDDHDIQCYEYYVFRARPLDQSVSIAFCLVLAIVELSFVPQNIIVCINLRTVSPRGHFITTSTTLYSISILAFLQESSNFINPKMPKIPFSRLLFSKKMSVGNYSKTQNRHSSNHSSE